VAYREFVHRRTKEKHPEMLKKIKSFASGERTKLQFWVEKKLVAVNLDNSKKWRI
jgi:hypothetical protein